MTDPTPDRPLVTFALFAYNQEQYIREAVEGAFSQTYEPLEIILSDDCSSDRTFEIMQEMSAAYEGPHEVRVRRSIANVGTLAHLLNAAKESKGKIFVVAAGDDISLPERTAVMAQTMLEASSDQVVASSDDEIFDNEGKVCRSTTYIAQRRRRYKKQRAWFHGATACYRTKELRLLPIPENKILFEDIALQAVFSGTGMTSIRIEKPLVRRRSHAENVGQIRQLRQPGQWPIEEQALLAMASAAEAYSYAAVVVKSRGYDGAVLLSKAEFCRSYSRWPSEGFSGRILLLPPALRYGYGKAVAIRIPGKWSLVLLKSVLVFMRRALSNLRALAS